MTAVVCCTIKYNHVQCPVCLFTVYLDFFPHLVQAQSYLQVLKKRIAAASLVYIQNGFFPYLF